MSALAYLIYIAGAAAVWLQLHHYWAALPDPIALFFDADGKPGKWMPVRSVFIYYITALGIVAFTFITAGLLVDKKPRCFAIIPNRDYWLLPEHRSETLQYMKEFYLWTGAFAVLSIAGKAEFVLSANMKISPQIDPRIFYMLAGTFAAGTLVVLLAIFWRFKKPATKA